MKTKQGVAIRDRESLVEAMRSDPAERMEALPVTIDRVAIQGELGSNSHLAASALVPGAEVVAMARSAQALDAALDGSVDGVVLPIENSLHGSVVDHYDLLLSRPLQMVRELNLRVRHQVIGMPGVSLDAVRRVMSHPVALSQCRGWFAAHPEIDAVTFYDTAGSVKHVMENGLRDAAGIAPGLAAEVYGGAVLAGDVEDHQRNYTRFHLMVLETELPHWRGERATADKMSLAFAVEHRPGTLVAALSRMAEAGADLTKIESRPVAGRPWEYLFYVDLRFGAPDVADAVLHTLRGCCGMVRELGRYRAAAS